MDELTVSIVNFNGGRYVINCLESLKKLKDEVLIEIFVLDNASQDGSIEEVEKKFKDVQIIKSSENLGFAKGQNQILKKIDTKYVLILNPDVEVGKGVIKKLIEYLDNNSDVGAITSKIVFPDGNTDLTAHRGFPTPWASFLYTFFKDDRLYHLTDRDLDKIHEVDSISGAFFLTRKDVLEKVGYFDEDFFMYGEDIDLCFRIKKAGFKIMYDPEVEIVHHKGISSGLKKESINKTTADLETKKKALDAFYIAMKIFYDKHYAAHNLFVLNWFVYLGINLKWISAKRKLVV